MVDRCVIQQDIIASESKVSDSWQKLFPNAKEHELIMRLNRTNMPVTQRSWIVVSDNLSTLAYNHILPLPLEA